MALEDEIRAAGAEGLFISAERFEDMGESAVRRLDAQVSGGWWRVFAALGGRRVVAVKEAPAIELNPFCKEWNAVAQSIHRTAVAKGWWETDRNDGEVIALMHSELSEALEALRHGNLPSDHIPSFSGVEEELADVVIRIMDYAEERGFRVAEAIEAKRSYNDTRAYKHGGKKF